jgi:hypothetical protein
MSFSPGQFITAQRLNRLQPKTYWAASSATMGPSVSGVDVTGTSIPITIETAGATVSMVWSGSIYAGATAGGMASNGNVRPFLGADGSPVFALAEWKTASEKGSIGNVWSTTVPSAGSYTAKLVTTLPANSTLVQYTTLWVVVTEVA